MNLVLEDESHALHVAGIILSQQISNKDGLPLGIATNSYYQMIHRSDLLFNTEEIKILKAEDSLLEDVSVESHAKILNLFYSQEGSFCYPYLKGYTRVSWNRKAASENNLLCNPSIKIFNISLAGSGFTGSSHYAKSLEFLAIGYSISCRADCLFSIGLGNEGLEIDSSPILGRMLRALATNPNTKGNVLFATNLLEDGMTLSSTSNVPGNHKELQERTLSAVGTNVESTWYQKDPESEDRGIMSGTSMATPKVTGVAAVVLSNHKHLSHAQLAESLLKGSTPLIYDPHHLTVFALHGYTSDQLNKELNATPAGINVLSDKFSTSTSFYKPDQLHIDQNIWQESQKLYGQGRVNLKGALEYAESLCK